MKQTIGWSNILPWSTFWRTSAPVRSKGFDTLSRPQTDPQADDQEDGLNILRRGAPQGGLVLHWLSCTFFISVSAVFDSTESFSFSGNLLTYARVAVGFFIGLIFPIFGKKKFGEPLLREWKPGKQPRWLKHIAVSWLLGLIYSGVNIVILILSALGPYINTDGKERKIKGWLYPVITGLFWLGSLLYYFLFLRSPTISAVRLAGVRSSFNLHGKDDTGENRLGRRCDLCEVLEHKEHRHSRDGYRTFLEFHFPEGDRGRNLLYQFFGGPNANHHSDLRLDNAWTSCRDWVYGLFEKGKQRVLPQHNDNPVAGEEQDMEMQG